MRQISPAIFGFLTKITSFDMDSHGDCAYIKRNIPYV